MVSQNHEVVDARPISPVIFEKIDTLPFLDAHVRQMSSSVLTCEPVVDRPKPSGRIEVLEGSPGEKSVQMDGSRWEYDQNVTRAIKVAAAKYALSMPIAEVETLELQKISDLIEQGHVIEELKPSLSGKESSHAMFEDYDDIDTTKVDRYGFFAQATQRRVSDTSVEEVKARSRQISRKSTMGRAGIKRASMHLGLAKQKDSLDETETRPDDKAKEVQRSQKWMHMAKRAHLNEPFQFVPGKKVRSRVFKGIPDCWRSSAWSSFLYVGHHSETNQDLVLCYNLLNKQAYENDEQIDLDVPRTISGHVLFRNRHEGGQRLLFRVLHAIALKCPKAGYVQGMASVAATLLCYYPEENTFIMLFRLWTDRAFEKLYEPGFAYLLQAFTQLEMRMQSTQVGRHLSAIGCSPMSWATRWYLTIFHISVPFRTQLRIWDILMYHDATGKTPFAVLEATTLALIEGMADLLLACEFDQAMRILTRPIDVEDDDRLIQAVQRNLE